MCGDIFITISFSFAVVCFGIACLITAISFLKGK